MIRGPVRDLGLNSIMVVTDCPAWHIAGLPDPVALLQDALSPIDQPVLVPRASPPLATGAIC